MSEPPSTFPKTILERDAGDTRTPCKKPSFRSSIKENVEKIAVNKRIRLIIPGKKN